VFLNWSNGHLRNIYDYGVNSKPRKSRPRSSRNYEAAGKKPTTFNIAADVYRVEPDADGNRWISEAQHTATKRALANLRRKGLVSGKQQITVYANGSWGLSFVRSPRDHRAERCCIWSINNESAVTDNVIEREFCVTEIENGPQLEMRYLK
jgi:hypothetical protein